jgi:hypothetical protein
MTASWAEPLIKQLEESRRRVLEAVPQVRDSAWEQPSEYPGWSYKDHLSHLPASHNGVHGILQAVIAGRTPDFSRFSDIDGMNEENRQSYIDTCVDDLLKAFSTGSAETVRLLAQLSEEHAGLDLGPFTLSQAILGFTMHDFEHLEQIKKALA